MDKVAVIEALIKSGGTPTNEEARALVTRLSAAEAAVEIYQKSLRDQFAMAAIPCAWDAFDKGYWTCGAEDINRTVAEGAYQLADAMIQARQK